MDRQDQRDNAQGDCEIGDRVLGTGTSPAVAGSSISVRRGAGAIGRSLHKCPLWSQSGLIIMVSMVDELILRFATLGERGALEALQRRASLMWEEDREPLLAALRANPSQQCGLAFCPCSLP